MDRAAKLAAEARLQLDFETRSPLSQRAARRVTRKMLCREAETLGFSDLEISAAVDEALTAAGTAP